MEELPIFVQVTQYHFQLNYYLVSFGSYYSDSKRSALIMFCFPKYKYTLEFSLYDEYPLMFHEYDNISIVDLSNKKIQEYRTNRSEKVIYILLFCILLDIAVFIKPII